MFIDVVKDLQALQEFLPSDVDLPDVDLCINICQMRTIKTNGSN